MNTLIYGLQYGDEGKGRVSAVFSQTHDWSIRFNGGPNAGHTVWQDGKQYKLNHLPAGAVTGKKIALDAGMVVNLPKLLDELKSVGRSHSDVYLSSRVHLITDKHLEEDAQGSGIGSTKRGIAYVYRDKVLRKGQRLGDTEASKMFNIYDGLPPLQAGETAIYESAQGVMLDIDYGCYPYVTSSTIFPSIVHNISQRIGVLKAYTSRVGDGPPNYPDIPELRELGQEYGTTTGRPRRCTWLVLDEVKYALKVSNPDFIVVTKLDILKNMKNIKIWNEGREVTIGNIDMYKEFLQTTIPSIRYISESADGDIQRV